MLIKFKKSFVHHNKTIQQGTEHMFFQPVALRAMRQIDLPDFNLTSFINEQLSKILPDMDLGMFNI